MKNHGVVLMAFALALSGCVSAGKYRDQEAKALAQQQRAEALAKDLDASKASLAAAAEASQKNETDLRSQIKADADQLASLNTQMASVQKSNKDLQESLDAKKGELSKKVADLIKEKDALSQKLADAQVETSNLRKAKDAEIAASQAAVATREKELAQARDEKAALEKAKADELAKVKKNYEDLTAGLKSEISAGEVTITQLKGLLTVNMVDRILFDSGQAEVRTDGKKVLEKVGKILATVADKDIRIEGHTDNKPIVGELKNKYATNWELSTARATAVARYLEDTAKLDPKRLVAAGYGEYRPIAANDTPERRALNRRIEIVLVPRE
ncbi:MAG TPA: chemotaxis protein MotB [Elusimicrobia bacterium]|nr:chemotaxis protein MotB [Elusimicrobiota bacterium]HBT61192.1 chemotaxis protein MotB [Elusimicrobiota bacterium]